MLSDGVSVNFLDSLSLRLSIELLNIKCYFDTTVHPTLI